MLREKSQATEPGSHWPHHNDIQRITVLALKKELVDTQRRRQACWQKDADSGPFLSPAHALWFSCIKSMVTDSMGKVQLSALVPPAPRTTAGASRLGTVQAEIQHFRWSNPNIYPICKLLECEEELVLQNQLREHTVDENLKDGCDGRWQQLPASALGPQSGQGVCRDISIPKTTKAQKMLLKSSFTKLE